MLDLKTLNSALEQIEAEKSIPKEKILEAIEDALAAAYKKDYGKRGQVIKANFDLSSGKTEFSQIKTVVDESMVRIEDPEEETSVPEKIQKK
ncbi:MAG: NusA N-terminal domain-containing protein [Patescibacteria group bacterium]